VRVYKEMAATQEDLRSCKVCGNKTRYHVYDEIVGEEIPICGGECADHLHGADEDAVGLSFKAIFKDIYTAVFGSNNATCARGTIHGFCDSFPTNLFGIEEAKLKDIVVQSSLRNHTLAMDVAMRVAEILANHQLKLSNADIRVELVGRSESSSSQRTIYVNWYIYNALASDDEQRSSWFKNIPPATLSTSKLTQPDAMGRAFCTFNKWYGAQIIGTSSTGNVYYNIFEGMAPRHLFRYVASHIGPFRDVGDVAEKNLRERFDNCFAALHKPKHDPAKRLPTEGYVICDDIMAPYDAFITAGLSAVVDRCETTDEKARENFESLKRVNASVLLFSTLEHAKTHAKELAKQELDHMKTKVKQVLENYETIMRCFEGTKGVVPENITREYDAIRAIDANLTWYSEIKYKHALDHCFFRQGKQSPLSMVVIDDAIFGGIDWEKMRDRFEITRADIMAVARMAASIWTPNLVYVNCPRIYTDGSNQNYVVPKTLFAEYYEIRHKKKNIEAERQKRCPTKTVPEHEPPEEEEEEKEVAPVVVKKETKPTAIVPPMTEPPVVKPAPEGRPSPVKPIPPIQSPTPTKQPSAVIRPPTLPPRAIPIISLPAPIKEEEGKQPEPSLLAAKVQAGQAGLKPISKQPPVVASPPAGQRTLGSALIAAVKARRQDIKDTTTTEESASEDWPDEDNDELTSPGSAAIAYDMIGAAIFWANFIPQ